MARESLESHKSHRYSRRRAKGSYMQRNKPREPAELIDDYGDINDHWK